MADHDGDALPEYDAQNGSRHNNVGTERGEQVCSLQDSKSRPWLWLKVKSRAKSGDQVLPLFFEGDIVEGSVEVDFDKADGAKSVQIAVSF